MNIFSPLDSQTVSLTEKSLYVPDLQEVTAVLQKELLKNFQEVKVNVVDCPNLAEEPFNLVGCGLGGSPTLLESGSSLSLLQIKDKLKVYNVKTLSERVMGNDKKDLFVIGAAAGPVHLNGKNCEIVVNMKIASDGAITNKSYEAVVEGADEKFELKPISDSDIFSYFMNLLLSEGKRDKVLRVFCKKRIGTLNFLESIRLALFGFYKEKCVGLGGVIQMENGTFTVSLSNISKHTPPYSFETEEYEVPGPLTALGTLLSHPNGIVFRVEDFHSFSETSFGGHYHIDNAPEVVEYEGYFNFAEKVVKADILHLYN